MLNEKTELMIKSFCLIVLITLNVLIYLNGKNLSCDKCQINFQSNKEDYKKAYNESMQTFRINISRLYNAYKNNDCYIYWDADNQGFKLKNDLQVK